jgi:site-specific recombinase XerD
VYSGLNIQEHIRVTKEMIEDYLLYLKKDKGSAPNSCASALSGLHFFYNHIAQQQICIEYSLSRKVQKLPTALPQDDIVNIINATDNLKHRMILMTTYSGGLRADKVIALKSKNIESKKMLIKVEKGKPVNGVQVTTLGVVGKVAKIHSPDHFLTKFGHVIPPWLGLKQRGGILHDQGKKDDR